MRLKDLSKLGYTDNVARSLAVAVVSKYCKHESKEEILAQLADVLDNPENYKNSDVWGKLAERFSPTITERNFQVYELKELPLGYKIYGNKFIETTAKQQMELAMRLPVTLTGALMPDAHAGYGLPIGGVLAVDNAVIPYAVGMDIGCRMSLTVFDAKPDFLRRYAHQAKIALKEYTHFGMDGGLEFIQEHEVLDREEFRLTPLLQKLHGKAVRQLGTSGQGNLLLTSVNWSCRKRTHCSCLPEIMSLYYLIPVHVVWEPRLHSIIVFWPANPVNFLAKHSILLGLISVRKRDKRIG